MTRAEAIRVMRLMKFDKRWRKSQGRNRCTIRAICRSAGVAITTFNEACYFGLLTERALLRLAPLLAEVAYGTARTGRDERLLPVYMDETYSRMAGTCALRAHGVAKTGSATRSSSTRTMWNPRSVRAVEDKPSGFPEEPKSLGRSSSRIAVEAN